MEVEAPCEENHRYRRYLLPHKIRHRRSNLQRCNRLYYTSFRLGVVVKIAVGMISAPSNISQKGPS